MHLIDLNGILADVAAPQTAPSAIPGPPQSILGSPVIFIGAMLVMMYFLFLRPQQQQRARHADLLKNLKSGDKVATAGGIVGIVISVKDRTVSLRSADAKMEVTKSSVTEVLAGDTAES